jgi:hypothetical protein
MELRAAASSLVLLQSSDLQEPYPDQPLRPSSPDSPITNQEPTGLQRQQPPMACSPMSTQESAMAALVLPPSQNSDSGRTANTPTSCCIFCGGLIPLQSSSTYNKRKRSLKSLAQFVLARCQPTPYGYQYFSAVQGEERVLLCISCVNWQRRASGAGRKKIGPTKKPMLLMDQVALFMLEPGTIQFPDQRCVLRFVMSLRTVSDGCTDWVPNLLLGLMPVQVQTMIGMLPPQLTENVLNSIVRVWWDYNGQTPFFAHHLTAKLVRKMIKNAGGGNRFDEMSIEMDLGPL